MTLIEILALKNFEWNPRAKIFVQEPNSGVIYGYAGPAEDLVFTNSYWGRGPWARGYHPWVSSFNCDIISPNAGQEIVTRKELTEFKVAQKHDAFRLLGDL